MPCSACGEFGHNIRTCSQSSLWETFRQTWRGLSGGELEPVVEDLSNTNNNTIPTSIVSPPSHYTNIRFDVTYTPSTRNRRPIDSSNSHIIPRSLLQEFENIEFESIFGDDSDIEMDYDSIPDLEPIKQTHSTLVDCVENPCETHDCPICMDNLKKTDLFVSRCGHQFHSTCMIQHMRNNDNCPMCRGVLFTGVTV